ncbi:amidohydrolase family protein [Actinomycetes bacterium KLBMP 9759]
MIDFHTRASGALPEASELLAAMDAAGIEAVVVQSAHSPKSADGQKGNDELAAFVMTDRSRMVGLGTVHLTGSGAVDDTRWAVNELGLAGLWLDPAVQGTTMHDPMLGAVCETLAECGGILLVHDSVPHTTPGQVAELARRFPQLRVVLGRCGGPDGWREALAAAAATDNVHLCVSGLPAHAARHVVEAAAPGRVVAGSGLPVTDAAGVAAALAAVDDWGIDGGLRENLLVHNPHALLWGSAG